MPVLESTEFTTPRSALRHRPIGDDSKQQERLSPNTSAPTPIVQRASRTRTTTDASVEVDEWERASGSSAGSVAAQPHIRRSNATTGPKTLSKTPTRIAARAADLFAAPVPAPRSAGLATGQNRIDPSPRQCRHEG